MADSNEETFMSLNRGLRKCDGFKGYEEAVAVQ
jgi:hypothetical protein